MTKYERWAHRSFAAPETERQGRRRRERLADRVAEIQAEIDAAGPAAVESSWWRDKVDAACFRQAEIDILDEWLRAFAAAVAAHAPGCRCRSCAARAFGGVPTVDEAPIELAPLPGADDEVDDAAEGRR